MNHLYLRQMQNANRLVHNIFILICGIVLRLHPRFPTDICWIGTFCTLELDTVVTLQHVDTHYRL